MEEKERRQEALAECIKVPCRGGFLIASAGGSTKRPGITLSFQPEKGRAVDIIAAEQGRGQDDDESVYLYIRPHKDGSEGMMQIPLGIVSPSTEKEPLKGIHPELEVSETNYGEPQGWLYLTNGRSIEVTHEEYGVPEEKQYYSIRLHCGEEELPLYNSTVGVIDTDVADTPEGARKAVERLLKEERYGSLRSFC